MNSLKLKKTLERLNAGHLKNFDPVRFALIESLANRLSKSQGKVNATLVEKTLSRAEQYLADFEEHRRRAIEAVNSLALTFPLHSEAARSLLQHCQFKQLEQMSKRLSRQQVNDQGIALLRGLTSNINQASEAANDIEQAASIDEMLHRQEQGALLGRSEDLPLHSSGRGEQLELQSMKVFRESMKHFNIDKVIARAIDQGPENPGPLNPQMLAIKSLSQMRDLSPSYLRRFAAYIETLLWLEKNSARFDSRKK